MSVPGRADAGAPPVDVVPLGGLGEFGLNMMAISCGDTTIVIDAGSMFPETDLPGVDLIVPDLDYLEGRKGQVKALVLTHGHEDHIGAVPYVLPHVDGPLYGPPLALALVEAKLEEHGVKPSGGTIAVKPRDEITIGPFTLEFIRVTHSIPDCVAVAIRTPQGVLLHTGDFKIDQTPLDGEAFDLHRLAQLGAEGVLALFCDSTNIDRRGYTGSEKDVIDAFEEIFTSTEGKIVVAAFSSSLYRVQILIDLAAQFDRKVAFDRPRDERELDDRAAARSPALSDRRRDQGRGRAATPAARRGLPGDRLAGRGQRRLVADRDRRSPVRQARRGRSRGDLGARDSWQREGGRSGDQSPGPSRSGRDDRGLEARSRVRPRFRRGAEARAVAGAAEVLRADSRRVSTTVEARQGGAPGERRPAVPDSSAARRERRSSSASMAPKRALPTRLPPGAC